MYDAGNLPLLSIEKTHTSKLFEFFKQASKIQLK